MNEYGMEMGWKWKGRKEMRRRWREGVGNSKPCLGSAGNRVTACNVRVAGYIGDPATLPLHLNFIFFLHRSLKRLNFFSKRAL